MWRALALLALLVATEGTGEDVRRGDEGGGGFEGRVSQQGVEGLVPHNRVHVGRRVEEIFAEMAKSDGVAVERGDRVLMPPEMPALVEGERNCSVVQ